MTTSRRSSATASRMGAQRESTGFARRRWLAQAQVWRGLGSVAAMLALWIGVCPTQARAQSPSPPMPPSTEQSTLLSGASTPSAEASATTSVVPNRLLVRFGSGVSASRRAHLRDLADAKLLHSYRLVPGLELLSTPASTAPRKDATATAAASALSHQADVRYAVPDVSRYPQTVPNDPLFDEQWGMQNIGAPTAWSRGTGSASVTVAVLDSGIALNHPDLEANIWTNPHPGDDGYANDVHGWNFQTETNDPSDDTGHGTHVSGIIGAVGNNGVGVAGINWSVKIMPLKICLGGGCSVSAEIAALEYAVDHGVKVANASVASPGAWVPEEEAIEAAGKAGLLLVAAAGNNEADDDSRPTYPAAYPLANIISVAAVGPSELAFFSNFGESSVDLGAPGVAIESTLPLTSEFNSGFGYGALQGTSMAAPEVTGSAALLWSQHPSWTMQHIRNRLLSTTRSEPYLQGRVATCGELDLAEAANPSLPEPEPSPLCVARHGTGAGSIASVPAGLDCGTTCLTRFPSGSHVELTATASSGSRFQEWRGACTGTGTCEVDADGANAVTAVFRKNLPAGWQAHPLASPTGLRLLQPAANTDTSFFNVALSADGNVRAKTISEYPTGGCDDASTGFGGVFLERRTASGWVSDGSLTAPPLGGKESAQWANCHAFGEVTVLSTDGSTLLVDPDEGLTNDGELGSRYRCAAFVYRRGSGGWSMDGTLYPPGVGADGTNDPAGCNSFGVGGAISADGTRAAILSTKHVFVFLREPTGWALERQIDLPEGPGCHESIDPRELALTDDGRTLMVGDPGCEAHDLPQDGRVWVYSRSGSTWSLTQTIESPESQPENGFGQSLTISGDGGTAAINAAQIAGGEPRQGGAWLYRLSNGKWQPQTRLTAPDPQEEDGFQCTVFLDDGKRVICPASFATTGYDARQGAVYIFSSPDGGWSSAGTPTELVAPEGAEKDLLGIAGRRHCCATLAASADGREIDAVITAPNLFNGTYPDDRLGYEFLEESEPPAEEGPPAQEPPSEPPPSEPHPEELGSPSPGTGSGQGTGLEASIGGIFAGPTSAGSGTLGFSQSGQPNRGGTAKSARFTLTLKGTRATLHAPAQAPPGLAFRVLAAKQARDCGHVRHSCSWRTVAKRSQRLRVTGIATSFAIPRPRAGGRVRVSVTVSSFSAAGVAYPASRLAAIER